MDFTLDSAAKALLDEYFVNGVRLQPIRIYIRPQINTPGHSLALAPDDQSERDLVFRSHGIEFLVSKHLVKQIGNWIRVDANELGGFRVTSENYDGKNWTISAE